MNGVHSLAADNERSFVSLFVLFFSMVFPWLFSIAIPALILVLVYLFRSFIQIGWNKRLDLRLEALFLFNQLEQDFGTVKIWL